jgi:hypothetical protein
MYETDCAGVPTRDFDGISFHAQVFW